MRYATLFGKTRRDIPQDIESVNGRLLARGGFIEPIGAGVTAWLPLGLRVLGNVQRIIREEMEAVGCQQLLMPALHPKEYWERTGRWSSVDILYRITSQTGKEYALGASHEEIVTPLAARFIHSYRDLPVAVYQIQTKFRDELRAKGGVLRGREFGMKDCYSFHATPEDFTQFYASMLDAYARVYERCGVPAIRVRASGGIFTERMSDEFHVASPSGEDRLLRCTTCGVVTNAEVTTDRSCPDGHAAIEEFTGIEVGNTFDLGTKYSDAVGLTFNDTNGHTQSVRMGCYGIGTTRLVGAIVEQHHDDRGITWPESVAPFDIHLLTITPNGSQPTQIRGVAEDLHAQLGRMGYSVLYDDRADVAAGEKFADADLIGIPIRLTVSERSLAAGGVERKDRRSEAVVVASVADTLQALRSSHTMGPSAQ